jgi:hypothetical protein
LPADFLLLEEHTVLPEYLWVYYLGFAVGCSEAIEYIMYTAATTVAFGYMTLAVFGVDEALAPIVWLAFYVSATSIHIYGGITFWYLTYFLSIISVLDHCHSLTSIDMLDM